jgi:hypothetical protein
MESCLLSILKPVEVVRRLVVRGTKAGGPTQPEF